jgi:hypothetical protein
LNKSTKIFEVLHSRILKNINFLTIYISLFFCPISFGQCIIGADLGSNYSQFVDQSSIIIKAEHFSSSPTFQSGFFFKNRSHKYIDFAVEVKYKAEDFNYSVEYITNTSHDYLNGHFALNNICVSLSPEYHGRYKGIECSFGVGLYFQKTESSKCIGTQYGVLNGVPYSKSPNIDVLNYFKVHSGGGTSNITVFYPITKIFGAGFHFCYFNDLLNISEISRYTISRGLCASICTTFTFSNFKFSNFEH